VKNHATLLTIILLTGLILPLTAQEEVSSAEEPETRIGTTGELIQRQLFIDFPESDTLPRNQLIVFYELLKSWAAENTDIILVEDPAIAGCRLTLGIEILPESSSPEKTYRISWQTEDIAFSERENQEGSLEVQSITTASYYETIFPSLKEIIAEIFPREEQRLIEVVRKTIVEEIVVKTRIQNGIPVTITGETGTEIRYNQEDYVLPESGQLILEAPPNQEMSLKASYPGKLSAAFRFFVREEPITEAIVLRDGARWGLEIRHRIPEMAPSPGFLFFLQPGQTYLNAYIEQNFIAYTYSTNDSTDSSSNDGDVWINPDEMEDQSWDKIYQPSFIQPVFGIGTYILGQPDSFFRASLGAAIFTRLVFEEGREFPLTYSETVTAGLQFSLAAEMSPFQNWRLVYEISPRFIYSILADQGPLSDYVKLGTFSTPLWIDGNWHFQYTNVGTIALRVYL